MMITTVQALAALRDEAAHVQKLHDYAGSDQGWRTRFEAWEATL